MKNSDYKKLQNYERLLKYIMVCIVLVMIVIPLYKNYKYSTAEKDFFISEKTINLGMLYPKYQTTTNNNKIFNINANRSLNQSENNILFYNISGDIEDDYYKKINFSAEKGLYNQEKSTIDFSQGVSFISQDNFQLESNKALYFLQENLIHGSNDIMFYNYMGSFFAQQYNVNLLKKQYIFLEDIKFTANDHKKTIIEAEQIVVNDYQNNMEVEKNAKYQDNEITLTSKKFIVFYYRDMFDKLFINKVIAYNNVEILHDDAIITGDKAIFYYNKEIIEIINNATVVKEENTVKGKKIIYDIKNDSFRVLQGKNNKVNLQLNYE